MFPTYTTINHLFVAKIGSSSITTGVQEAGNLQNISISPNPFLTETTIYFSSEQKNTAIKITDMQGKEIKSSICSGNEYMLEKGEMKSGIYFLQITDEKKNVVNKKVVVE